MWSLNFTKKTKLFSLVSQWRVIFSGSWIRDMHVREIPHPWTKKMRFIQWIASEKRTARSKEIINLILLEDLVSNCSGFWNVSWTSFFCDFQEEMHLDMTWSLIFQAMGEPFHWWVIINSLLCKLKENPCCLKKMAQKDIKR